MTNNFSSIYYPDCYIDDSRTLMTYLLIYDELHLVALSDDATNPTKHFQNLPDYTTISSITPGGTSEFHISSSEIRSKSDVGEINEQTRRVILFYQFVQRHKELIGDSIFFHPHILASFLNRTTEKLLSGGMSLAELSKIAKGQDPNLLALKDFQNEFPEIKDEVLWRTVPTALNLSKEKDLILVSDNSNIPVPVLSQNIRNVKMLTSILAQECVKIMIPACRAANPQEILEIRESLKDTLIPFRLSLQKLSGDLRKAIDADMGFEQIHQEAKFIAESSIEPAVYELRQSIERSDSKVFNKVFGKVLSWIPFVAKAYAMPTPDNLLGVAKKIGADSNALLDAVDDIAFTRSQGLSFLLKVEDAMQKK